MGSPSVFQTAPPHPASKARITWSPQLAGGPEASQNGFGQRMAPANIVVRSAMLFLGSLPDKADVGVGCGPGGPPYYTSSHCAIAAPARFPSATASTTSRPPFTQSPPA